MAAIRNERKDFRTVEELSKKAFWNVNFPGCNEHYIVHVMRNHRDFVPELDFVIEEDNCIIGNIMYTKSKLIDESGNEKEIRTVKHSTGISAQRIWQTALGAFF